MSGDLTDRHGRSWTWDDEFAAYRHDDGYTTQVKDLAELYTDCSPLHAETTCANCGSDFTRLLTPTLIENSCPRCGHLPEAAQ